MRKLLLLPLFILAFTALDTQAQYSDNLYASLERPKNFLGCSPYNGYSSAKNERNESPKSGVQKSPKAMLRLVNMSYYVQALINCDAMGAKMDYRVLRSTNPDRGWEFVAEIDHLEARGPVAVNDDSPINGQVVYKLEARQMDGEWETVDLRVVERPAGVQLDDFDFMTAPFGSLILPQTMLPASQYTVEIFDLQGGRLESSFVRYGHKLKVHTAHLPFGIYQVVVSGERSRTSKYFLSTGN